MKTTYVMIQKNTFSDQNDISMAQMKIHSNFFLTHYFIDGKFFLKKVITAVL